MLFKFSAKMILMRRLLIIITILSVSITFVAGKDRPKSLVPWSVEELFATPKYSIGEVDNGVVELIYESMDYRGHTKEVFAYYSTPGILSGDASLDKDLPAVVCVHGGGGEAFDQWVRLWAERGYAAISMDLRGFSAGGAKEGVELQYGFKEGAERKTPTFVSFEDQTHDWFYQAVGDVVIAHSLIRSFEEVDPKRTAIVGISWGGIMTTLVSGLDNRFSAAVPVYGCGYLFESGAMAPQIVAGGSVTQSRWRELYDPSLYAGSAQMPVMFINGTNDHHFHTDQWQKSSELPKNSSRSMRLKMAHGHNAGWKPEEIYEFVGSHLKKGEYPQTPKFTHIKYKDGELSCRVSNIPDGSKAYLIYTTHPTVAEDAKWSMCEIPILKRTISSAVEEGCRQCFIAIQTPSGANYSSAITFIEN